MEKEKFIEPSIEIIYVEDEDVISTSAGMGLDGNGVLDDLDFYGEE